MGDGVHGDHGVVITTQEGREGLGHVTIQLHSTEDQLVMELILELIGRNPAVEAKIGNFQVPKHHHSISNYGDQNTQLMARFQRELMNSFTLK